MREFRSTARLQDLAGWPISFGEGSWGACTVGTCTPSGGSKEGMAGARVPMSHRASRSLWRAASSGQNVSGPWQTRTIPWTQ